MIEYFARDTRPPYEATIDMAGAAEDLSTGHTFELTIATTATATPVLTKTTGITGSNDGKVTVDWTTSDLAVTPDAYRIQITVTRTADDEQWTVADTIRIKPRLAT